MNKTDAYKFLNELLERQISDIDRLHLLEDIIVNYFMCSDEFLNEDVIIGLRGENCVVPMKIKKELADLMKNNLKINAIKLVREHVNCGLKEAKDYVEAKNWGNVSISPIINKIRKDYKLDE